MAERGYGSVTREEFLALQEQLRAGLTAIHAQLQRLQDIQARDAEIRGRMQAELEQGREDTRDLRRQVYGGANGQSLLQQMSQVRGDLSHLKGKTDEERKEARERSESGDSELRAAFNQWITEHKKDHEAKAEQRGQVIAEETRGKWDLRRTIAQAIVPAIMSILTTAMLFLFSSCPQQPISVKQTPPGVMIPQSPIP